MAHAVLLIAGLVGGLMLPPRPKVLIGAALLAVLYVAVVTIYAGAHNQDVGAVVSWFLYPNGVPTSEPGLSALVVGAGIWVISVLVGAVRVFVIRRYATRERA
jgi:tellurite resistance protein TehA-like permease